MSNLLYSHLENEIGEKMDQFVELLKQINIAQIFIILAGFWIFYNRLDSKIEKNKTELKEEINKLSEKIEDLSEKVEDIDRRLCPIEGSLSTHGHCLFNQTKSEQKAQFLTSAIARKHAIAKDSKDLHFRLSISQ